MPLIDPLSSASQTLTSAGLISSILPPFQPSALLTVLLPSGAAALGAEVALSETVEPPGIAVAAAPTEADVTAAGLVKNETRYTLAMLDPDAPSGANPTSRSFLHWVVTGLMPADDLAAAATHPERKANDPQYRGPGPWKGSGVHRYTFALFREPPNFSLPDDAPERMNGCAPDDPVPRRPWSVAAFLERNPELELVGATFYLIRAEE
ncbi:phosphatidylethanolamine-binding protein [Roridomyces roridus]|uniref:Phosphatidylethanolamine-binding protein n=1 Tax=Roridomyces roridus TaxID=1738132 RepID=A0AAD7BIC3_9AGAR|nr:phosphatidylethanolamine-binding protein [Roridomyces roridus]